MWFLLPVFGIGCLEPNPDWRSPPHSPDLLQDLMCSQGLGVNAKSRAEVLVQEGTGPLEGSGSYVVKQFFLDVTEITVDAYRECMGDVGNPSRCKRAPAIKDTFGNRCNWSECPGDAEKHPVTCIDWQQAYDFCKWAGRRLPTEVEWEYAAGGPSGMARKYPWGSEEPVQGIGEQLCWGRSTGTCQVDSFARTLLGARKQAGGIADLAGNVWEWTGSEYTVPFNYPAKDCNYTGLTSCSVRGGAWRVTVPDPFLAAYRGLSQPRSVSNDLGARCARTP